MTPVFCCGFECGQIAPVGGPNNGQHWFLLNSGPAISTTIVRSGARSLHAASGQVDCNMHTSLTRHIGRFYLYFETLPGVDTSVVQFGSNASSPRVFFKASESKIYAALDSITLGASGVSVITGQWYRIDYDFNVNTAGADFCDVQVDGVVCGQATGNGTSSGSFVDRIVGSGSLYFDDFVFSNTAADYPIGAGYVNHFIPTADGTHNGLTAGEFQRTLTGTDIVNATTTAFQLVDDIPLESGASVDWINMVAPSAATDYVECVFGPAPGILAPTWGPRAVEVIAGIHQAATTNGNMEIRINDNGTTNAAYTATAVAGVTSIAYKRKHYATAIAGGGPWIATAGNGNFNNLRVRFGSPASVDANPDQYFDCIMVEAEFPYKSLIPESYIAPRFYIQK